jgi:hypothetical protein
MNTVFWSWQSDLDARVTRDVICEALIGAVADLDAELDERIEMTSDTKGVAGTPDIVATILAKIERAQVFVGDVTPLALSAGGKALANPNVLIELGYAKHAIGLERVILVWNTAFPGASIDKLPFDMAGRRSPMAFHLPAGAPLAELRTAREGLRKRLREALRLSIAVATPTVEPLRPDWQSEGPAEGLWFDPSVPLTINDSGTSGTTMISEGPYRFVRILPRSWLAPTEYGANCIRPVILGPTQGYSWGTVKGGYLTYTGSVRIDRPQPLTNFVMQFRETGEIWGVDAFIANGEASDRFFADAAINHFFAFIRDNIQVLQAQGAKGPFEIIMGVTDLRGLRWASETRWGGFQLALEDKATATFAIDGTNEDTLIDAMLPAWGKIASAFGIDQPPREVILRQMRHG